MFKRRELFGFEHALRLLKNGKRLCRDNWRHVYIYIPNGQLTDIMISDDVTDALWNPTTRDLLAKDFCEYDEEYEDALMNGEIVRISEEDLYPQTELTSEDLVSIGNNVAQVIKDKVDEDDAYKKHMTKMSIGRIVDAVLHIEEMRTALANLDTAMSKCDRTLDEMLSSVTLRDMDAYLTDIGVEGSKAYECKDK